MFEWGPVGALVVVIFLAAGASVYLVRRAVLQLRAEITALRTGELHILQRNLDLSEQANAQLAKLVALTGVALRRQATAAQCRAVADWVAAHSTRFARRQTRDLLLAGLPTNFEGNLQRSDVAAEDMKEMLYAAGNWNEPTFIALLDAISDMLTAQSADGAAFADLRATLGL